MNLKKPRLAYTVVAEFENSIVAEEWVSWLQHEHMGDVLQGGAVQAVLVQRSPLLYEVRYVFPDEKAFEMYERLHALKLRVESMAKFPTSRGVRLSRWSGEVLSWLGI